MRQDVKDILIFIAMFLSLCFFLYFTASCKTCQPIEVIRDSVRVEFKHDSVYVYKHDSIFRDRWRSGDTVYVTTDRWRTLYKDKLVEIHDTIATTQTNTVQVKYTPPFYKNCTIALWALIAGIVITIIIRVLIKVYLHK